MAQHQHHHHPPRNFNFAFAVGVFLNLSYVVVEVVYGFLTDSLVLVSDAGHNFSDVLSLALAWGASLLAGRRATLRRTFGLRRATILASLLSALLLLMALGAIAWEAVDRFRQPAPVDGFMVMIVAGIGVGVNTGTALLFASGRKRDLNIRGAFLHMAADAAVSLGAVISGLVIMKTGWYRVDPGLSLVIAVVILVGTLGLLRDSLNLAMDAVPKDIDPDAVRAYLASLPGVVNVHDFHVWGMSTTQVALTVHLIRPDGWDNDAFLDKVASDLHRRFGIEHATIQIEQGSSAISCNQDRLHCA